MSGPFTGTLASILAGEAVNGTDTANWHDILDALTGPSTAYTPVSNATSIGTGGTLTGKYWQMGKLTLCAGRLILGTSPTLSASALTITTPTTAVDIIGAGAGTIFGSIAANRQCLTVNFASTTTMQFWSATGIVNNATPFAMVATNQLGWWFAYESA